MTLRLRHNRYEPQCIDCSVQRAIDSARDQKAKSGPGYIDHCLAVIAWADAGGIERADASAKWKANKRRYVERLRALHGEPTPAMIDKYRKKLAYTTNVPE